ncbi:MAG: type II toxin-antitoxin system RelE/ParE family toxin [Spirochaetales bacterium]|nr:type II toxin-antitoxin system RelE/ParE family toxin [Spirochaetales bacterium]MBQ7729740.1 type II toxin-antitoxin system RelE/ParE family toxin [Spirochaetales bacterium]
MGIASHKKRILFAGWTGDSFVLLHCFVKKTTKTPTNEIERAQREFDDFKRRNGDG